MANPYDPERFKTKSYVFDDFKTLGNGSSSNVTKVEGESNPSWISDSTKKAAIQGGSSGGLSGALTSGGVQAMMNAPSFSAAMAGGGPWAIGGGLILSQIEAAEKEKARAEAERIQNEKNRRQGMIDQYNSMARVKFGV